MMPYVVCILSRLLSDPMAFIGNWPLDDLGDVLGRVRQPPCHLRWRKYIGCRYLRFTSDTASGTAARHRFCGVFTVWTPLSASFSGV